nr:hypothetical protein [uncultured Dongia sp.]
MFKANLLGAATAALLSMAPGLSFYPADVGREPSGRPTARRPLDKKHPHKGRGAAERGDFQFVVEAMTNRERKQWARAGYPGLRDKDLIKLKPFAFAALRRRAVQDGRDPDTGRKFIAGN